MKRVIFGWSILVSILAVIICGFISAANLYSVAEKGETYDLVYSLNSILEDYDLNVKPDSIAKELSELIEGLRITIINENGDVIGDSLPDSYILDNHEYRPEFEKATTLGLVVEKRWSDTMGQKMIYVSKKDASGNVLRLSKPIVTLREILGKIAPAIAIGILLALLFSGIVTNIVLKKILSPIYTVQKTLANMLAYKILYEIPPSGYDELDYITECINRLSRDINAYVEDLNSQKNKFEFILDNIDQGVILLDSSKRIMIANRAAISLLKCSLDITNKPFVNVIRKQEVLKLLDDVYTKGVTSNLDFEHHNTVLSLTMLPTVFKNSGEKGAIVNILDVTSLRKTDQIKTEFIANASHELKTPVTSIKGFSDLLCSDMVTDPDKIADYNRRINNEAERMIYLIEDILFLADLESYREPRKEVINLTETTRHVVDSLDIKIREKELFVTVTEEDIWLEINPHDIVSILTNLIENAVKYNVQGGEIAISIFEEGNKVIIIIKDTGIGISPELQSRVFERFYRIDKGRSRKIGGTGLGLAIVKHAVSRNGGTILLESQEGVGTSIKIDFYKF